jgi:hypothetical protein
VGSRARLGTVAADLFGFRAQTGGLFDPAVALVVGGSRQARSGFGGKDPIERGRVEVAAGDLAQRLSLPNALFQAGDRYGLGIVDSGDESPDQPGSVLRSRMAALRSVRRRSFRAPALMDG